MCFLYYYGVDLNSFQIWLSLLYTGSLRLIRKRVNPIYKQWHSTPLSLQNTTIPYPTPTNTPTHPQYSVTVPDIDDTLKCTHHNPCQNIEKTLGLYIRQYSNQNNSEEWILCLTAHNWQNWKKRVFLSFYCLEIYREEAVGLQIPFILKIIHFLWMCEILDNFLINRYFANNCLIKVQIWAFFCTHAAHVTVIIFRRAIFVSTKLILVNMLNTEFPSQFCIFNAKSLALLKD